MKLICIQRIFDEEMYPPQKSFFIIFVFFLSINPFIVSQSGKVLPFLLCPILFSLLPAFHDVISFTYMRFVCVWYWHTLSIGIRKGTQV